TFRIAIHDPVFLRTERAGAETYRGIERPRRRAAPAPRRRERDTRRPPSALPGRPCSSRGAPGLAQSPCERDDVVGVVGHARRAELGGRAGAVADGGRWHARTSRSGRAHPARRLCARSEIMPSILRPGEDCQACWIAMSFGNAAGALAVSVVLFGLASDGRSPS